MNIKFFLGLVRDAPPHHLPNARTLLQHSTRAMAHQRWGNSVSVEQVMHLKSGLRRAVRKRLGTLAPDAQHTQCTPSPLALGMPCMSVMRAALVRACAHCCSKSCISCSPARVGPSARSAALHRQQARRCLSERARGDRHPAHRRAPPLSARHGVLCSAHGGRRDEDAERGVARGPQLLRVPQQLGHPRTSSRQHQAPYRR